MGSPRLVDLAATTPGHGPLDPASLSTGAPRSETYRAAAPHHGVTARLGNGQLIVTLGTEDARTGMVVLDADGKEIVRNEDCPDVHGEATAKDNAVVIGCQTGVLIYRNGVITKVNSPTRHGRIGNRSGSDVSRIMLGDYKPDRDAELERPQQISLIDTTTTTLRTVDIGTSYTFRSLARGPQGEPAVLGTDRNGADHPMRDSSNTPSHLGVSRPLSDEIRWCAGHLDSANVPIELNANCGIATDSPAGSVSCQIVANAK